MVLLAAAICTKSGKAILSRQFVEMTKSRIEGLLAAFPKLLTSGSAVGGRQHTFAETESVRYVYQPLDKLYMLLITTKASNILEDLETLRLFSRVIPEYSRSMDEAGIIEHGFELIFAFDEIVALGYRESVNLAQVRTFVEMDSHEEKVYQAVRQSQEREAKQKMREKAKELQKARMEAQRGSMGRSGYRAGQTGFGSSSFGSNPISVGDTAPTGEPSPPFSGISNSYKASPSARSSRPSQAMKLGGKHKDIDSFVDQLKSEGEEIIPTAAGKAGSVGGTTGSPRSPVMSSLHPVSVLMEEKITLLGTRDGGLNNMEVHGLLKLRISQDQYAKMKLFIDGKDERGLQMQPHPNIDKDLFRTSQVIAMKNRSRPFPLNTEVGVLKWRFQSSDPEAIPLAINCWPSDNGQGGCDVNIEYDLQDEDLELKEVNIVIPLQPGASPPKVADCDGDYKIERNTLIWSIPLVDAANKTGAMEFTAGGNPSTFFPVLVHFTAEKSFAQLRVKSACHVGEAVDGEEIPFGLETVFTTERYEIA
ncbi:unnamed protein product [Cyprideis torosa]|uniref:Coatomer subunit delta n=1 Tax=Cyprideis torosa TaxID=163714 RepID=A0A7R8ZI28_9CRUS|nr:unnamed protein product [Cyprideis torosa]CAG0885121.1 unnamed protein product [Cyprideis torosa]